MPKPIRRPAALGASLAALALACTDPAAAAGQRSFVSTSGVDNPTCSLVAPCRAFASAIDATDSGGEIIVLGSGGYGAVAITKSVSIVAPPGVCAGVSVFSGNGITVTTAASDTVKLEGLAVNNQGSSGDGIRFDGAGTLVVDRVEIAGFDAGAAIRFDPMATSSLVGADLHVRNSSVGIWVDGGATSVRAKAR